MADAERHFVVATLWEYVEPLDRGDRYEDPLDEALAEEDLGEVCGGGTQISKEYGIEFVDIEIELDDLPRGLQVVKSTLESQGASKGGVLRYTEDGIDKTVEVGVAECLAIFLDGVNLPDDVYQSTDINDLADQIDDAMGAEELGEIRASWCGPEETALFIYGPDAERLYSALQPILEEYPLCQNARVVIRHGKPELKPRAIRLPRWDE